MARSAELTTAKPSVSAFAPVGGQFARFVVVGASNTALTLATYALLLAGGLHYLYALVPAFALGALNGYTLNRAWTFRAGRFQRAALARYVAVQLAGLGANALALVIFIELLAMPRVFAQLLATPLVSCLTFAGSRCWVFAQDTPPARDRG
jgi:putative flippase GtrA